MKILSRILFSLALVMTASAADVTGKWAGAITPIGPDGQPGNPDSAYFVMKQSGATITGSGGPNEDQQWPMQNGKIVEDKITAEVVDPDGAVYRLTMTVNAGKITGEVTVEREGQTMKAKIELTQVQ